MIKSGNEKFILSARFLSTLASIYVFHSQEFDLPEWTSSDGLPKWSQSPVDLNKMYLLHDKLPCLKLTGHLSDISGATMTNNGITAKVELCEKSSLFISGGPLKDDDYKFQNLEFRWGPTNARGAEHSIDNTWFTMEAQATHYNTKYGSVDDCYEHTDGFVVFSVLFQAIGCPEIPDNPNFAQITDHLKAVRFPGRRTPLPRDCFKWLKEVVDKPGYYTYKGSFTTSPYQECVQWIIMPKPIYVSSKQVDAFRSIYDRQGERIISNFREKQYAPAFNRKIYFATA